MAFRFNSTDQRGIKVDDDVRIGVDPPENASRFVNETTIRNLTVTGDTGITVTDLQANTTYVVVQQAYNIDLGWTNGAERKFTTSQ